MAPLVHETAASLKLLRSVAEKERERESSYMKVKHMLKHVKTISLFPTEVTFFASPCQPRTEPWHLGTLPAVGCLLGNGTASRWRQAELCLLIWWDTGPDGPAWFMIFMFTYVHIWVAICSHMFTKPDWCNFSFYVREICFRLSWRGHWCVPKSAGARVWISRGSSHLCVSSLLFV